MNRLLLSKALTSPLRQSRTQWPSSKVRIKLYSRVLLIFFFIVRYSSTTAEVEKPVKKMVTFMHPTAPLASFNKSLVFHLRTRGPPKRVLENVLKIVQDIKQQNLRLDLNTYNALLTAYSRAKEQRSMLRTLDEMKENNVEPSVDSYNIILEVRNKTGIYKILY